VSTSVYTLFGELKADTGEFKSPMKSADAQLHQVNGTIDDVEQKAETLGRTTDSSARGFDRMREAVNTANARLRATAEAFEENLVDGNGYARIEHSYLPDDQAEAYTIPAEWPTVSATIELTQEEADNFLDLFQDPEWPNVLD